MDEDRGAAARSAHGIGDGPETGAFVGTECGQIVLADDIPRSDGTSDQGGQLFEPNEAKDGTYV